MNGQDAKQWQDVFGTELPKLNMKECQPLDGEDDNGSATIRWNVASWVSGVFTHKTNFGGFIKLHFNSRLSGF
jgi:hypothetical protein